MDSDDSSGEIDRLYTPCHDYLANELDPARSQYVQTWGLTCPYCWLQASIVPSDMVVLGLNMATCSMFQSYGPQVPDSSPALISIDDLNSAADWDHLRSQLAEPMTLVDERGVAEFDACSRTVIYGHYRLDCSEHTERSLDERELTEELDKIYNPGGTWKVFKDSIASAYRFKSPADFVDWTRLGRSKTFILEDIVRNLQKSISFSIGPPSVVIPGLAIAAVKTATSPETNHTRVEVFSADDHEIALSRFNADYLWRLRFDMSPVEDKSRGDAPTSHPIAMGNSAPCLTEGRSAASSPCNLTL